MNALQGRVIAGVDSPSLPQGRRGQDKRSKDEDKEISSMTTQETVLRESFATRFTVIAGLALLLIAACASAFSMLLWGP